MPHRKYIFATALFCTVIFLKDARFSFGESEKAISDEDVRQLIAGAMAEARPADISDKIDIGVLPFSESVKALVRLTRVMENLRSEVKQGHLPQDFINAMNSAQRHISQLVASMQDRFPGRSSILSGIYGCAIWQDSFRYAEACQWLYRFMKEQRDDPAVREYFSRSFELMIANLEIEKTTLGSAPAGDKFTQATRMKFLVPPKAAEISEKDINAWKFAEGFFKTGTFKQFQESQDVNAIQLREILDAAIFDLHKKEQIKDEQLIAIDNRQQQLIKDAAIKSAEFTKLMDRLKLLERNRPDIDSIVGAVEGAQSFRPELLSKGFKDIPNFEAIAKQFGKDDATVVNLYYQSFVLGDGREVQQQLDGLKQGNDDIRVLYLKAAIALQTNELDRADAALNHLFILSPKNIAGEKLLAILKRKIEQKSSPVPATSLPL